MNPNRDGIVIWGQKTLVGTKRGMAWTIKEYALVDTEEPYHSYIFKANPTSVDIDGAADKTIRMTYEDARELWDKLIGLGYVRK